MSVSVETLRAYEQWAPIYPPVAHNPLMRAEQVAMQKVWPNMAGRRVLDLACGTGRYSRLAWESGAAGVIALDFCMPMLTRVGASQRVCASMLQLPFHARVFDAVVSGLALGHVTELGPWMTEVARVLLEGGVLLYSDFHREAARAGLTRSFKDGDDVSHTVPHQLHALDSQLEAAAAAGLSIESVQEIRVGYELCEPFAGSESFYRDWHGLPIVLVVRARR